MSEQTDSTSEEQDTIGKESPSVPSREVDEQGSDLAELRGLYTSQAETIKELHCRMDKFDKTLARIGNHLGILRGSHARSEILGKLSLVADYFSYNVLDSLSRGDILDLSRTVAQGLAVSPGDLKSFTEADAIIKVANQNGDHIYLALEISFTVAEKDISRATRNAGYIKHATGIETFAVVAGVDILPEVQERTNAGEALFYPIPARELAPE
ncbi:MAG: hypothetical protein F4Y61_01690 [Rhodothermaceae bacterium]|nr:hypothetical protein [Rhodothermaceae bacterium]